MLWYVLCACCSSCWKADVRAPAAGSVPALQACNGGAANNTCGGCQAQSQSGCARGTGLCASPAACPTRAQGRALLAPRFYIGLPGHGVRTCRVLFMKHVLPRLAKPRTGGSRSVSASSDSCREGSLCGAAAASLVWGSQLLCSGASGSVGCSSAPKVSGLSVRSCCRRAIALCFSWSRRPLTFGFAMPATLRPNPGAAHTLVCYSCWTGALQHVSNALLSI